MKKILLIILAVVAAAGLVAFFIYRQQSGYTKVLTAKIARQDLATVVSGTGQIKPKTYVNVGATSLGRITHLLVKEGDHVKKGQTVATIENVQQEANVAGQQATIAAAKTDIASYIAAEKTSRSQCRARQGRSGAEAAGLGARPGPLQGRHHGQAGFRRQKGRLRHRRGLGGPGRGGLNQAKAQTDSARGHLQTQVATLRANQDALDLTIATAPFDGIVTNLPVREGETVVVGIQNAEGSTLMTLADMSVITAEVKVDETDIVNIQIGQPAEVTVDALPGKVFKGHVTLAGDQACCAPPAWPPRSPPPAPKRPRTSRSWSRWTTPSSDLRPGLSTTAKITTAHKSNVLSLPIQALTMHNPDDDKAKGGGVQAASSSPAPPPRARPCRASMWWTRTRAASCGPSSFRSPPASPAPPTSRCSPASTKARRSSPAPTRRCAPSKTTRWSSGTPPSRQPRRRELGSS
jgi:HlyD family secretion protein